jgi:sugar transferase (PEP-CTERM system associated)
MFGRMTFRVATLVVLETALIVASVAASAWLRLGEFTWSTFVLDGGVGKTLLVALVVQACLYYADLYNMNMLQGGRDLFVRIVQALGAASFILAAIYFWFPNTIIGRGVFMISVVMIVFAVVTWRMLFDWAYSRLGPRERLLIVGTNPAAIVLAKELHERRHHFGVTIVGFVDPDPARVGEPLINPGVIGTVDDIPAIVRERQVDRVVVSLADARGKLPMDRLLDMKLQGNVRFAHLPSVYEEFTGKIAVENLRPSWLIFSDGFRKTTALLFAKRTVDIAGATAGLLLAAPLMVVVAAAVRLTSRGPALYRQQRVGLEGKVFTVNKFRSMRHDAEAETGAVWAQAKDGRVTSIGSFLRRTRLDELPQLWNVLVGDMSMVGPRPERPEFVSQLTRQIPFYGIRHSVRPGVTGWAQVSYTYGASVEDALEKLQYDLFYIKHMTVPFDLFVLFSTIKTVILRRGAQ